MPNPRSLIFALYTHWETVELLVKLGRGFPAFDQDQIISVINRTAPSRSREENEATLRQMLGSELLHLMPRGSSLQINPQVVDFVRGLIREHELGLSTVLKAMVDAIKTATERLITALQNGATDELRHSASALSELFRQIAQQLNNDHHAILELVERAKSRDANWPMSRRYHEVLTAYDSYIAPMIEMMDTGPSGTFYRHLEAAEHALDLAVERLNVQGSLYTQRLSMRQVAFQAKEVRRLGREVLKHCSDSLLPLREAVRQHNVLSSAISKILGQVRKRGLQATLNKADLPLWRRDWPRRVTVGTEVLGIMAAARDFEPDIIVFPREEGVNSTELALDLIDESALFAALKPALPIQDLLSWLRAHYAQVSDTTLLRLYHMIMERQDWDVRCIEQPNELLLNTVRIHYVAHSLIVPMAELNTRTAQE